MTPSPSEAAHGGRVMLVIVDAEGMVVEASGDAIDAVAPLSGEQRSPIGQHVRDGWAHSQAIADGLARALRGEHVAALLAIGNSVFQARFAPRARNARRACDGGAFMVAIEGARSVGPTAAGPESRIRAHLGSIRAALWMTDQAGRITALVGRAPRLAAPGCGVGLSEEDAVGMTLDTMLGDTNDVVMERHRATLRGEGQAFRYACADRVYDVRLSPVRGNNGQGVIGSAGAALDVTELHHAERELERSARMLRHAEHTAHVGSWEWDPRDTTARVSDELCRIYGIEPSPSGGGARVDMFERVHGADRARVREAFFRTAALGGELALEHRIVRADGEIRMLSSRGELVRDAETGAARVIGSSCDVTERIEATARLEHHASLLQATLESTADGIAAVDRDGRITRYNRRLLTMWKIDAASLEVNDLTTLTMTIADQLEAPDEALRRATEVQSTPDAEAFDTLLLRDGRVFDRYTQPQRVDGTVVGRVWSFRDVTEREWALRRSVFLSEASELLASLPLDTSLEAVAKLAVQGMADVCWFDLVDDESGPRRIAATTPRPALITPTIPRATFSQQPLLEATAAGSRLAAPLLSHGELLGMLCFAVGPRGRAYGRADLALAEELARRASSAIENARLREETEQALQARDEFLAIAAHELRGPLMSLQLAVQQLEASGTVAAGARRAISIVVRQTRVLSRFVTELVDATQMRRGHLQLLLGDVDLSQVAREAVVHLETELTRAGSALTVTTEDGVVGRWDRARVEQVAMNLLTNAVKFGGGKPIEVRVSARDGIATLVVCDHGIGIPPDRQAWIFDPFQRVVSSRNFGGLGIGLFIVQQLVEAMGGEVRVSSVVGEGSTFTVDLPQSSGAS